MVIRPFSLLLLSPFDSEVDSLTDRFYWVPLNTFGQKCTLASSLSSSRMMKKGLKKGALEFTIIYNRVSSTLGEDAPQILGGVKADGGEEAGDFFDGGG